MQANAVSPIHNRILAVMAHTSRYAFKSQARLAQDTGVSPSAISRLVSGQSHPSFSLVLKITLALEKQLGKKIDPRELISFDGVYPTVSVCDLCGCKGCLPDEVYDENDTVRPEYRGIQSGQWQPAVAAASAGQYIEAVSPLLALADTS